jgi:hypothetical protein
VRPQPKVWLAVSVMSVALLASCSPDGHSRDEVIAKIKSDPSTQGASDRTAGCIADWYMKYATSEQISAFLNGSPGGSAPAEIAPNEQAKADIVDCLKLAADDR